MRERQAANSGVGRARSIGAVSLEIGSSNQDLVKSCSSEIISYDLDDPDSGGFGIAALGEATSGTGGADSRPTAVASSLGTVVPATRVTAQSSQLNVPLAPATRVRLALPPSTASPPLAAQVPASAPPRRGRRAVGDPASTPTLAPPTSPGVTVPFYVVPGDQPLLMSLHGLELGVHQSGGKLKFRQCSSPPSASLIYTSSNGETFPVSARREQGYTVLCFRALDRYRYILDPFGNMLCILDSGAQVCLMGARGISRILGELRSAPSKHSPLRGGKQPVKRRSHRLHDVLVRGTP